MTSTTVRIDPAAVARCARHLGAVVDSLFAPLEILSDRLDLAWRSAAALGAGFSTEDLAALEPSIFQSLDRVPEFDGAGYVMAVGSLVDRDRYLEWWHRGGEAVYHPLILNLDPSSPDHYDYDSMEWFVAGSAEGRRFVSGPLIDLPCAESHIMTFSRPVVVDGVFVGVAGADVAMSRLEALVVPPLRRLGAPAVLVNGHRRVIAGSHARWAAGDKLRSLPSLGEGEWQATYPGTRDLGWVLGVAW